MSDQQKAERSTLSLAEFLMSIPPSEVRMVKSPWSSPNGPHQTPVLDCPTITQFCKSVHCNGPRLFDPTDRNPYLNNRGSITDLFLHYKCRNCKASEKVFGIRVALQKENDDALLCKYGEYPSFGDPLPAKLRKLVGDETAMLDKGYLAERSGLGIAAFAYYRRVVESIKARIIDEIISASKTLGASADVLADLEAAKKETRFTEAVKAIKHGIPQSLYINGHSPLLLLHDALSDHLHGKSDDDCLEVATIVRVLLAELAEKLASVFADRKEVEGAVNALLKKKAARTQQ